MNIRDIDGWEAAIAANPIPAAWSPEPEEWPSYEEMTESERGDAYGAVVIVAAGRWMEAMEDEMGDTGESVADVADRCFRQVDADLGSRGLTGFQYGAAVSVLAQVWEHGEDLRRWHNLAIQIHDEGERANETGGVLNPALISFEQR